ncbi:hypothetical protein T459_22675 [Capsicum annuum]|uniref:Uncharacterized protein n=1 Tax=Capsicum annuum TaxID=4072 RepID=A0A2G2YQ69_CAPAN|nr:hypothetical protein T459_22675 [Capsicum annuum]
MVPLVHQMVDLLHYMMNLLHQMVNMLHQMDLTTYEGSTWKKCYYCRLRLFDSAQIKQSLKEDGAAATKKKLDLLQKENIDLLDRLE